MDLPPAFLKIIQEQKTNPIVQQVVAELPVFNLSDETIANLEIKGHSSFMIPYIVEDGMVILCRSNKHKTMTYSVRVKSVNISGNCSFVFFETLGRAVLLHTCF